MKITTLYLGLFLFFSLSMFVAGCSSRETVYTAANEDEDVSTGKVFSDPKADLGRKERGGRRR